MQIVKRNDRYRVRVRGAGLPPAGLSRTFAARKEAESWGHRTQDAARSGKLQDMRAGELTVAALVADYVKSKPPRNVQSRDRLNALARGWLGKFTLSALTRSGVRQYRLQRLEDIKESTWNRELSALRVVLRHALDLDAGIDWRGVTDSLRGAESPGRTERLQPAEQKKVEDEAAHINAWLAPLVRVAVATGARRGELFRMEHADIDRKALTLHVRGSKTKASDRHIALDASTLAVLDALPRSLASDRVFWMIPRIDDISRFFRAAAKAAGVSAVFHSCRHECLSRLGEEGATVAQLKAHAGHATLSQVARYCRPDAEFSRALVERAAQRVA